MQILGWENEGVATDQYVIMITFEFSKSNMNQESKSFYPYSIPGIPESMNKRWQKLGREEVEFIMQLCCTNREVEKYKALCTYTVQTENMSIEQRDAAMEKEQRYGC